MADIFISYASPDRETARLLAATFTERGHSVWWDRTIPPGRVFDDVIQEALNDAKCIVVLWSANSVRSNWVKTEASEALTRNRLVPALIEQVLPPIEFKRIQAANLTAWQGETDNLEFRGLLTSVEQRLALASNGPSLPPPASVRSRSAGPAAGSRWGLAAAVGIAAVATTAAVILGVLYFNNGSGSGSASSDAQPQSGIVKQSSPAGTSSSPGAAAPNRDRVNLLLPENGGELLTATDNTWKLMVDGNEKSYGWVDGTSLGDATFGFRDGSAATFDTVTVLIPGRDERNVRQFELLAGNDGPSGPFRSVGVFTTQNQLMVKAPFQAFTFAPVTAKVVKIRPLSGHAATNYAMTIYEWQLFGRID